MDSICVPADPEYQMPVLHAMGWNMYMQYLEDLYDVRYIIIYVILISFGTGLFLTMIMRFVGHIFVWGLITTLQLLLLYLSWFYIQQARGQNLIGGKLQNPTPT